MLTLLSFFVRFLSRIDVSFAQKSESFVEMNWSVFGTLNSAAAGKLGKRRNFSVF